MRWIVFVVLSLALSSGSLAQKTDPLCVLDPSKMPENWRPPAELRRSLSPKPWSESEAKDAEFAIRTGLDEMIDYFRQKPAAVRNLWDDSIEALIQVTYASVNKPEFDAKARDAARNNLTALLRPFLQRNPELATCDEFEDMLPLAIFAHRLYPANDRRTVVVTKRVNAAYRACGSLGAAIKIDYRKILAAKNTHPEDMEDLFALYVWCLWFIEAELYPDIELPAEAHKFAQKIWEYFEAFRLAGANEFETGAEDATFIKIANLATHIAHIPTGTHRFPLYVEDKPDLYRFHRENFYPALQSGTLDLFVFASLVDSLRQYGCSAENDMQVRDGTRYLLKAFHDSNDRWMNYRRAGETDADLDDYALIHLPWTGALGLRGRKPEQPKAGTYGGIVRRWLRHPRSSRFHSD
jgi:hypothetical protein